MYLASTMYRKSHLFSSEIREFWFSLCAPDEPPLLPVGSYVVEWDVVGFENFRLTSQELAKVLGEGDAIDFSTNAVPKEVSRKTEMLERTSCSSDLPVWAIPELVAGGTRTFGRPQISKQTVE